MGIIAFFKIEEIKEFGVLAFESDKTGKSLEDIWETKDHIKEQLKIFLPDIVEDIFKNKYAKYDLLHSLSIAINSIDFKNVFNPIHIDNHIKTKIDIENNIENTRFTFSFDRFVYEKDLEKELVDLIQFLIISKMTHYENPDDDKLFHKSLQTFQTRMFKKIVKKNPYYTNIVKSIQDLQNNLGVWKELEKHGKTQKNTTRNVPNRWSDSR